MLREREATLRERATTLDRTLRKERSDTTSAKLELLAHRDRLDEAHDAEERRLRALGLAGTLPLARRQPAAAVDLEAFGLVSVAKIFDDVERGRRPPGSVASPSISAFTESASGAPPALAAPPPGYLQVTKAAAKRASKNVARREAREARRPDPPTARERRLGVPL